MDWEVTPDEEGIRFTCQRCGACCRDPGEESYVFLLEGDLERLAEELAMSPREIAVSFLVNVEGHLCLASHEGDCIFLDDDGGCRVYGARPLQCRTWPFWPQNMGPHGLLAEVAARCPGLGSGRFYSKADIRRLLDKMETTPLLGISFVKPHGEPQI